MSEQMPFEVEERDQAHIVHIRTHVTDRLTVDALAQQIRPLAVDREHPVLIIDFTDVKEVSSAILGVIMGTNLKIARNEGKLRLCGLGPELREIFHLTKLDTILPIDRDVDEALGRIG